MAENTVVTKFSHNMYACRISGGIISNYATVLHGCFFSY